MRTIFLLIKSSILFFIYSFTFIGYCQINMKIVLANKSQDTISWTNDKQIIFIPRALNHTKSPAIVIDKTGIERKVPALPKTALNSTGIIKNFAILNAPNGKLYAIKIELVAPIDPSRAPKKDQKIELFKFDLDTWQWEGEPFAKMVSSESFNSYVLSENYLLGIASSGKQFKKDGHYFPFAIFKKNGDGLFELDHFEDAGLAHPAIKDDGTWAYPFLSRLCIGSKPLWTGDHSVFFSGEGIFWCFDEKGNLKKIVNLFQLDDELLQKSNTLWPAGIIGAQPSPDGSILVSCLNSKIVEEGEALLSSLRATPQKAINESSNSDENIDGLLARWPIVSWYSIDVDTGKATETGCPNNSFPLVNSTEELNDFNWTFKGDGSIQFYTHREMFRPAPVPEVTAQHNLKKPVKASGTRPPETREP